MNELHTYEVEFTVTRIVNAKDEDEAYEKARELIELDDLYDYINELEYNPEYDD